MADVDETPPALAELAGQVKKLRGQVASYDEAAGVIASHLGKVLPVNIAGLRGANNAPALAASVGRALEAAKGGRPALSEGGSGNALLEASIESLKTRIGELEGALRGLGVDPITVRGEEPEGFRDPSHGEGGRVVEGAAANLARDFAEANEIAAAKDKKKARR